MLEGETVVEAIDAAANYPPDKILLSKEGKNAAWLYLATFRVINGDFINDRDGGQGLWTDINSKLINGRRDMHYIYAMASELPRELLPR